MDQSSQDYKYQKHSEKQFLMILAAAEKLFVEKGIEKVNFSDISNECGIMRSTLYRYFRNKDEVLWHIVRRKTTEFSLKFVERFNTTGGTKFDRYKVFLDILSEGFVNDKKFFLFIRLFNNTYQNVTSLKDNILYNSIYAADDFRSGDTVRFLMEDFHDSTVKASLDPKTTAVTVTYSAISIVAGMSGQVDTLTAKYGVSPEEVVRISLKALLESIKP
jgi:AcrR family transcriptional regulator